MNLHLDEDADAHALLIALRQRGVDVTSNRELALLGSSDEEQLSWAVQHDRVLYTYNACDFCRLHAEVLSAGQHHPGIVIGDQQIDEMRSGPPDTNRSPSRRTTSSAAISSPRDPAGGLVEVR
jgi:hypothetical protein